MYHPSSIIHRIVVSVHRPFIVRSSSVHRPITGAHRTDDGPTQRSAGSGSWGTCSCLQAGDGVFVCEFPSTGCMLVLAKRAHDLAYPWSSFPRVWSDLNCARGMMRAILLLVACTALVRAAPTEPAHSIAAFRAPVILPGEVHVRDEADVASFAGFDGLTVMRVLGEDVCTNQDLADQDCFAVLQFLIAMYGTAHSGGGVHSFFFTSPHTPVDRHPVRPWLNNAMLGHGAGTFTPNTCVSQKLLSPSSSGVHTQVDVPTTEDGLRVDRDAFFGTVCKTHGINECQEVFTAISGKTPLPRTQKVYINHDVNLPVTVDGQQRELIIAPKENPFFSCQRFCDAHALSEGDCAVLTTEAVGLYAISLRARILQCTDVHFAVVGPEEAQAFLVAFYVWSPSREWSAQAYNEEACAETGDTDGPGDPLKVLYPTSGDVVVVAPSDNPMHHNTNDVANNVRVSLSGRSMDRPRLLRVSLNSYPVFLHDHVMDFSLVHVNLSLLKVGTWCLLVQAGDVVVDEENGGLAVQWSPVHHSIFDVVPATLYHPTLHVLTHEMGLRRVGHVPVDGLRPRQRPLRVVHVTSLGGLDGQSRVLVAAALNMDPQRVDVTFISTKEDVPPADILEKLAAQDIDYLHIPLVIPAELYHGEWKGSMEPLVLLLSQAQSFDEIESDQVRGIVGTLLAALRGADVVTFTNIARRVVEDTVVALTARLANVPIILCDPGNLEQSHVPTVHGVTGLLVPSYRAKRHWEEAQVAVPIHVLWPGSALEPQLETPIGLSFDDGVTIVAFVGRLHPVKSPGMFLRAAAQVLHRTERSLKFVVIGDGSLRLPLETMAREHFRFPQDAFEFLGKMTNEDLCEWLRQRADVVVHTTLLNETFGLSIVEGMSAGASVVTFGVGGISDFLSIDDDSHHGYIVPEPSAESLAATVERAIEERHAHGQHSQVGARARAFIHDHNLTVTGMARRFEELYEQLVQRLPPQSLDHRWTMSNLGRDSEGVWAFNHANNVRWANTSVGVEHTWYMTQQRLRQHRGVPMNECCCGNCILLDDKSQADVAAKALEFRRQLFLPFFKERASVQYSHLTQAVDKAGERPTMMFPKRMGPFPVSSTVRGTFCLTSLHKLQHDIEQLTYLVESGKLPASPFEEVVTNYTAVWKIEHERNSDDLDRYIFLGDEHLEKIGTTYNMLLYLPLPSKTSASPHALNPLLNYAQIERDYFAHAPGFTFIDQLLAPETLLALRSFLLESTIFFDVKQGYLGAYHNEGLSGPLLRQLERELKQFMPRIFRHDLPLVNMWSYKCDQRYVEGLNVHADAALVNFNIWLTEDEANLDPSSGGLIVYLTPAPVEWDFAAFNALESRTKIYAFLESVGAEKIVVPFRSNRAVVFHSQLFHESDRFRFKKGYKNRRINLTLLFGYLENSESRVSHAVE